jgi:hypothetical protein
MQAHTKKHPTESGLVSLHFLVHPANVKRITRYVKAIEPDDDNDGSVTVDEFFDKHFSGESTGSVALKGYRYRESLTQQQLSNLTHIPQRHLSEMENGKRGIGKDNAVKLAEALHCDYRVFL